MQTVTKAAKNKYLRNKLTYYYEIHPLQKSIDKKQSERSACKY